MSGAIRRLRVEARGAVQGVGFRPFVHRLAVELHLAGWVRNSTGGAEIEVEGAPAVLETFLERLRREIPPHARLQRLEHAILEPAGMHGFEIQHSDAAGETTAWVLPDLAPCAACVREIFDPADRRFRYPFGNCTCCGPRFSIQLAVPWDRPRTTMREFPMCADCRREYDDPADRRFHAQPIACPACGPRLRYREGEREAEGDAALRAAVAAIREGRIAAVQGLGGFHLMCDARDAAAVARLRERKARPHKPFAVLAASLDEARRLCELSAAEEELLGSREAPIVLARGRAGAVAEGVAPGNPRLGVMLPSTPLHHLMLRGIGGPVVATSGNHSDEPVCIAPEEARRRLGGVADAFLVHNRPIARPVEDSVVRVLAGRPTVLRRSRGYAPLPLPVAGARPGIVAAGAHQKNTVAVTVAGGVILGAHTGDLDTPESRRAHADAARDLPALHAVRVVAVACDAHPDYASTAWARGAGAPVHEVQHHLAHVLSCVAEHAAPLPVLGLSWDGAGLGADGTLWGGECLDVRAPADWSRVASLRPFPLPGGERAAREPRRSALGLAFALRGADIPAPVARLFAPAELRALLSALRAGVNAPVTSSAGRLFDAVAALLGLRAVCSFEGQAAMDLEAAAETSDDPAAWPLPLAGATLDTAPLLDAALADAGRIPVASAAARFHNALAAGAVAVARRTGRQRVALTGGCFQNGVLAARVGEALERAGFAVLRHGAVPPGDGGLALGQAVAAGS